jgi:hypothetical protein
MENGLKTGNFMCVRRVTEDICKMIHEVYVRFSGG